MSGYLKIAEKVSASSLPILCVGQSDDLIFSVVYRYRFRLDLRENISIVFRIQGVGYDLPHIVYYARCKCLTSLNLQFLADKPSNGSQTGRMSLEGLLVHSRRVLEILGRLVDGDIQDCILRRLVTGK